MMMEEEEKGGIEVEERVVDDSAWCSETFASMFLD